MGLKKGMLGEEEFGGRNVVAKMVLGHDLFYNMPVNVC